MARRLFVPDHHELTRCPALVQSGAAARLRLQPQRGPEGVPRGHARGSRLRHVLLGHRHHGRLELQPPDRRRPRGAGAHRRAAGPGPRRDRPAGGARDDPGPGQAPLRRSGGQARGARRRLRRGHARGGPAVPRRSGGRHVLRRRHDEPPAVEPVGAGRHGRPGHGRARADAGARAGTQSRPSGRAAPLHPRGRGQHSARARGGCRRPSGAADAGRRPHGPHAVAHLLARGTLHRRGDRQPGGGAGRPGVLQDGPAEPDLSRPVLPAQHRLHLAVGQHAGTQRRDAARRPRVRGQRAGGDDQADAGHGDRAGRADGGARALRPLGRRARAARAPARVALHHRRVALRSRRRLHRQGPGRRRRAGAGRAGGRGPVGAGRAHGRVLLPGEERPADGGQRAGRRDGGQGRRHGQRRAAAPRRDRRAGHALVHGAAAVVLPRAPVAGRRAAAGRPARRRRGGLPRGPAPQPGQRLVAVRAVAEPAGAGQDAEAGQTDSPSARRGRRRTSRSPRRGSSPRGQRAGAGALAISSASSRARSASIGRRRSRTRRASSSRPIFT